MESILGGSIWSFLGLAVAMFGAAGWMMGQALALTWRSPWSIVPYSALLAITARFLDFALFHGDLAAITGFVACWAVIGAIAAAGFRATRAGQMVAQYPWLFERVGPFSWRARG